MYFAFIQLFARGNNRHTSKKMVAAMSGMVVALVILSLGCTVHGFVLGLPSRSHVFRLQSHDDCSVVQVEQPRPGLWRVSVPFKELKLTFETGRMGKLSSGSVTATLNETILYSTVNFDPRVQDVEMTPFRVDYASRFSAVGMTSGNFRRRDGMGDDHDILTSRLIDRPLRPTIDTDWQCDSQILGWLLSHDKLQCVTPLAICAASAALAVSEIPITATVAAVEIGLVDGELIVNPGRMEKERSNMSLVIAGTKEQVTMIEGGAKFVSEEIILQAVTVAQQEIARICLAIDRLRDIAGKPKRTDLLIPTSPDLKSAMHSCFGAAIDKAFSIANKIERGRILGQLESQVLRHFASVPDLSTLLPAVPVQSCAPALTAAIKTLEEATKAGLDDSDMVTQSDVLETIDSGSPAADITDEGDAQPDYTDISVNTDSASPSVSAKCEDEAEIGLRMSPHAVSAWSTVSRAYKHVLRDRMSRLLLKTRLRVDGRQADEIRPIDIDVALLPGAHGSALFTRGETQVLATATLGLKAMEAPYQSVDEGLQSKGFYLQYRFPPSAVGETGRAFSLSRREIGHGSLAETALSAACPMADFENSIRAESLVTESCGSSSMATICGCSLALLDAGVPLREPVAGIAMGLIEPPGGSDSQSDDAIVLSDILGLEDFLGNMDLKVAGGASGVTAIQLDVKNAGLSPSLLARALNQARVGRLSILDKMNSVLSCARPRNGLLKVLKFAIPRKKIGLLIGAQGRTIEQLRQEFSVSIEVSDEGEVRLVSPSDTNNQLARDRILAILMPKEGTPANRTVDRVSTLVGKHFFNCRITAIHAQGVFVAIPTEDTITHKLHYTMALVPTAELQFNSDRKTFAPGHFLNVVVTGHGPNGILFASLRQSYLQKESRKAEQNEKEPPRSTHSQDSLTQIWNRNDQRDQHANKPLQ